MGQALLREHFSTTWRRTQMIQEKYKRKDKLGAGGETALHQNKNEIKLKVRALTGLNNQIDRMTLF